MARLGDCFSIIRNGVSIKQIDGAAGLPITRIETISNRVIDRNKFGYADIYDISKYEDYLLHDQDILMSHINSEKHLGKVAIYHRKENEQVIHGMNLLMLRANQDMLYPQYAAYYFESTFFKSQIVNITKKSVNQASFTVSALKKLEILILSLDEQRKIAAVLDKVSDLIAKRHQQLDKLDEIVKSQFIEWFGVPGTDSFGWGLKKLGECCELNPRRPKAMNEDTIYSFVAMPSVSEDGRIGTSIARPYKEVCKGFTYFAENDVLFAKITPCMENGKGGVATGLINGAGFGSTEFHVLRPIKGTSDPYWLYIITMFQKFRSDAEKVMTGTGGQRRVPITYLSEYRIAVPPIDLQEQFAAFVQQSDKSKLAIQKSLEKLEILKKSLMQQYFG